MPFSVLARSLRLTCSRPWAAFGLLLGGLLGACAADAPSQRALQPGDRAKLAPDERALLDALLPQAEPAPALVGPNDPLPRTTAVRIVDGHLDGLALVPAGADRGRLHVGRLPRLRALVLDGAWSTVDLGELPSLVELEIHTSRQTSVQLGGLPALEHLLVQGARTVDLPTDWPSLRSLAVGDTEMRSFPALQAPKLSSLGLVGNRMETFPSGAGIPNLEVLNLASNGLRTLNGLPHLPRLRRLELSDNRLDPQTPWPLERVPNLRTLGLRRTGLPAIPHALTAALATRTELRLDLDDALEPSGFDATLERLRRNFAAAADQRALALPSTSGRALDSAGRCTLRTGTHRRAEIRCDLDIEQVDGTMAVRLAETDLTLPFSGGGAPRVTVELSVEEGSAAIYLPMETDLIDLARAITSTDREEAERARQAGDRFEGYAVAVARPGAPARAQGDVALLGSRVVIWLSADLEGGRRPARGIRLSVRPTS